jgi:Holliday junction resolvase-like predicted endonuclease
MVRKTEYGHKAEDIVLNYLKSKKKNVFLHGTKGYHFRFGDIQIGINKDTCKIIEVKGEGEDFNSQTDWDVPRHNISISKTEYEFLEKYPKRFEVWIVYRLKYNKNPKWNKPKIAICKGNSLLEQKYMIRNYHIKTPNMFWESTEQFNP